MIKLDRREKAMKKILVLSLILSLSLSLALGGCSTTKKPAPKPAPPAKMTPTPSPAKKPATSAHTRATKLAKAAEKVEGVKSATVVITDSTAMVGLETNPNIEAKKTEEIKTKVADEIKRADTGIKTVSITTDPNLITRLKKVAQGIKEGKPISSFADEIAEITRRITPKTKTK
jgi:YhcN/YlaJ family sporulation lipoprotein